MRKRDNTVATDVHNCTAAENVVIIPNLMYAVGTSSNIGGEAGLMADLEDADEEENEGEQDSLLGSHTRRARQGTQTRRGIEPEQCRRALGRRTQRFRANCYSAIDEEESTSTQALADIRRTDDVSGAALAPLHIAGEHSDEQAFMSPLFASSVVVDASFTSSIQPSTEASTEASSESNIFFVLQFLNAMT